MVKPSFAFNIQSRVYEQKLREAGHWDRFHLMRESARTELTNHEADYKAHRASRIEQKMKDITDHQSPRADGPRMKGSPPKRSLTADEIKIMATSQVDHAHKTGYEKLYKERHSDLNGFVRQALRLPPSFDFAREGFLRNQDRDR